MDNIDAFLYINLDHRTDKKEQVENEILKMDDDKNKIIRISGVYHKDGCVGCTLAHVNALKLAKERGYKNFIILEDDFEFLVDKETFHKNVKDFFELNMEYKMVMLTYSYEKTSPFNNFLGIINECSNSAGYICSHKFIDELILYLEFGAEHLSRTGMHWIYTIDQIWKQLQNTGWYYFIPKSGRQRACFSDINNTYVDAK
jgi:GR25 family glycosyltransferase involved in LPS biosynthesis